MFFAKLEETAMSSVMLGGRAMFFVKLEGTVTSSVKAHQTVLLSAMPSTKLDGKKNSSQS